MDGKKTLHLVAEDKNVSFMSGKQNFLISKSYGSGVPEPTDRLEIAL